MLSVEQRGAGVQGHDAGEVPDAADGAIVQAEQIPFHDFRRPERAVAGQDLGTDGRIRTVAARMGRIKANLRTAVACLSRFAASRQPQPETAPTRRTAAAGSP